MINTERIKNYIKEHPWVDAVIIIFTMILFTTLFCGHIYEPLTDRGRELLIPEQILNGHAPYKDITLIYFPLAYYINAFIYKILGVSLYSLLTTQFLLCTFLMLGFYFLCREFLNRKISLLITLFVIASCVFCINDLFGMIYPYSFAMVYGLAGFWLCVFSFMRLYKTDKIKYAYIAAFCAGFSVACKLEFYVTFILLFAGLCFYKKLQLTQYFKIFLTFLTFPLITVGLLLANGVSVQDIKEAIKFACKFTNTPVMKNFLNLMGMFPFGHTGLKLKQMTMGLMNVVQIIFFCSLGLFLYKKNHNIIIFPVLILFIFLYFFDIEGLGLYWAWFPILMMLLVCINFKRIKNGGKELIFFVIAAFLLCQRQFFFMSMYIYASFALPFLILLLNIIVDRYAPKDFLGLKTESVAAITLAVLIMLYTGGQFYKKGLNNTPIYSDKGTIYTTKNNAMMINTAISYVKNIVGKDETVLFLPEGSLINFMTDTKVDSRCSMLDRLYYSAYGPKKSIDLIKMTDPDYIMIVNFSIFNFQWPYLYADRFSPFVTYIFENYGKKMMVSGKNNTYLLILKKMTPEEKKNHYPTYKCMDDFY